jgi:hypothetical protein
LPTDCTMRGQWSGACAKHSVFFDCDDTRGDGRFGLFSG